MTLSGITRFFDGLLAMAMRGCARDDKRNPEFTPRAQQEMALARRVAIHRQKTAITGEDLLAGICALSAGLGFDALSQCRITPAMILADLGASDGCQKPAPLNDLPYDDSIGILLTLAVRESKRSNHDYTGTDHMLIAMLHSRARGVRKYFIDRDVTLREIEMKLTEVRENSDQTAEGLPPATRS